MHFPAPLETIVVGMFRVAAKLPCRANEAAREAKTTSSAKANFVEMFDMGGYLHNQIHENPNACLTDLGSQSVDNNRLKFIEHSRNVSAMKLPLFAHLIGSFRPHSAGAKRDHGARFLGFDGNDHAKLARDRRFLGCG